MSYEWIGDACGKSSRGWFWLAECDYGDLYVPGWSTYRTHRTGNALWRTKFDRRKPWHWLPYLRSRLRGNVVMIERY